MIIVVLEARSGTATAESCWITEEAGETQQLCCSMHKKSSSPLRILNMVLVSKKPAQYRFLVDVSIPHDFHSEDV